MSQYPTNRGGLWAWDFVRLMIRAQVAEELGSAAFALLVHVAEKEHSKDYLNPPNFWNRDLKIASNLCDDHAFAALRSRCVKAGWLVHQRGPYASAAGLYWVAIPPGLSRAMGGRLFGGKPQTHPQTHPRTRPPTVPQTPPQTDPPTDPQTVPPTHPQTDPQTSKPSPNPPLPPPTHPHTPGVGVGGGEIWQTLKDRRARIEAILDSLQVATGPKATGRWMEALKTCKRVRLMADAESCLREAVGRARAAGETVNYASDVADRIRRWKPEVQS